MDTINKYLNPETVINSYLKSKPLVGNFLADKFTNDKKNKFTNTEEGKSTGAVIGGLIFFVILLFALYLAWRCNAGFWGYFFALFFPEFYIIYKLVTNGMCGLLSKSTPPQVPMVQVPVSYAQPPVGTTTRI
jgi:hypothetical protein